MPFFCLLNPDLLQFNFKCNNSGNKRHKNTSTWRGIKDFVSLRLVCSPVATGSYPPGQAEISHFDFASVADQAVACGQVAVDVVLGLQVRHSITDLKAHHEQLGRILLQLTSMASKEGEERTFFVRDDDEREKKNKTSHESFK